MPKNSSKIIDTIISILMMVIPLLIGFTFYSAIMVDLFDNSFLMSCVYWLIIGFISISIWYILDWKLVSVRPRFDHITLGFILFGTILGIWSLICVIVLIYQTFIKKTTYES